MIYNGFSDLEVKGIDRMDRAHVYLSMMAGDAGVYNGDADSDADGGAADSSSNGDANGWWGCGQRAFGHHHYCASHASRSLRLGHAGRVRYAAVTAT